MLGFLGRMFGTAKAGEQIISGAMSGIDKMWYTKEEKAEDAAQAKREAMTVYMKWLESTSGSRIARRLLALGAFMIWATEHIAATIVSVSSIWSDSPEKLEATANFLADTAQSNNTLVGVVFAFYFGGPVLVDASANMLKKWTNTETAK